MGKYLRKKKKKNNALPICLLLILLAAGIGCLWLLSRNRNPQVPDQGQEITATEGSPAETTAPVAVEITEPEDTTIELSNGLRILHIGGYAGIYMEDGTDEVVSDVMMLVLENTASEDLQLARIYLQYADFTAEFEVTNIPSGAKLVALERNRHPETAEKYQSVEVRNLVFFQEPMGLSQERIRITGTNGSLIVENISGQDIAGDIYIYYKNSATDLLYGGITYRVSLRGGLAAGESSGVIAGHYSPDNSRILWVDCGE